MLARMVVILVTVLLLAGSGPALAEKRLALVIGNDSYRHIEPLKKARGDASAIGAALESIGFDVTPLLDADRDDWATAFDKFKGLIEPGDVVVVHFSGHGVEIDRANYLLPVDAPAPQEANGTRLKKSSYDLRGDLIEPIRERGARVAIFIVDACRDNPYASVGDRSVGGSRGLARVAAGDGEFILFSAGPHQTARDRLSDDDPVPTSVFTRILVEQLTVPELSLVDLAKRTQSGVRKLAATIQHRQFPDYSDRIDGNFTLVKRDATAASTDTRVPVRLDSANAAMRNDFAAAKAIGTVKAWRRFLELYASGFLSDLASDELMRLCGYTDGDKSRYKIWRFDVDCFNLPDPSEYDWQGQVSSQTGGQPGKRDGSAK